MNLTYGRYDKYEQRMHTIACILQWLLRYKWFFAAGFLTIIAFFVFLGVVPGIFVQDVSCPDHIYGDEIQFQARAIMSDVSYEFSPSDGEASWSEGLPVKAGTYRIRAISHNGYGKPHYSDEMCFTIHPAQLVLKVKDVSQTYGELTDYNLDDIEVEGMRAGDALVSAAFTSEDVSICEMSVSVSSFSIRSEKRGDVTDCYSVKIVPGALTFTQRIIGLSSGSLSKDYDGNPLAMPACTLTSGSLALGNEISFIHDPNATVTLPGSTEARFSAVITDEQGRDVTANYQIHYSFGTLTVNKRPITVTVPDTTKVYDGSTLTVPAYKITSGSLPEGSTVELLYETERELTRVGMLEVRFTAKVLDSMGQDVTDYYVLTCENATLTVTPRPISLSSSDETVTYHDAALVPVVYTLTSGSLVPGDTITYIPDPTATIINVGSVEARFSAQIFNGDGENVSDQYTVSYTFGQLTVEQRLLKIQTISGKKLYDGKPLQNNSMSVVDGSLVEGHTIKAVYCDAPIHAGEHINKAQFSVLSANGRNVTENYDIQVELGTLTIDFRYLTVQSGSAQKTYDGTPLTSSKWELKEGSLATGQRLSVKMTGSQTDVGESKNNFQVSVLDSKGQDVTEQGYKITLKQGTLKVIPRPIEIKSDSAEKHYDGRPLTVEKCSYSSTVLVSGQKIVANYTGKQTNVGSGPNTFTAKIQTKDGKDVSFNYSITTVYGTLTVTPPVGGVPGDSGGSDGADDPFGDTTEMNIPKYPSVYPVLRIMFSEGGSALLRGCSYGDYNGSGFESAPGYSFASTNPLNYAAKILSASGKAVSQSITVYGNETDKISFIPYYLNNSAVNSAPNDISSPVKYQNEKYSNVFIGYDYRVFEGCEKLTLSTLPEEKAYRTFVHDHYLSVPESTAEVLLSLAQANGVSKNSPTLISDIQKYIQNAAKYNLETPAYPAGVDQVIYFLTVAKEGVCQQYAASATLMYRLFGIPARYTVGYSAHGEAGVITDVMNEQAHAWVEIYMDGIGWVAVDVTPPDESEGGAGGGGGSGEEEGSFEGGDSDGGGSGGGSSGEEDDVGGDGPFKESTKLTIPKFPSIYPVFQVKFAEGGFALLRERSYGDYTGSGFGEEPSYAFTSDDPQIYAAKVLAKSNKVKYQNVTIRYKRSNEKDLLPYYTERVQAHSITSEYSSELFKTAVGYDYRVFEGCAASSSLLPEEKAYRAFVYENYLNVPESTAEVLLSLAKTNGISKDSPTLISDIQKYIQNAAKYNLNTPTYPAGVDWVVYFLTVAKEGVCQQYAASATLMYRLFGIPAKYTVGYSVQGEPGVLTDVTNDRAHAWVEIYLDGIGWVAVEVTGSADSDAGSGGGGFEEKVGNVIYAKVYPAESGLLYLREMSYGDYAETGWKDAKPYIKSNFKPLGLVGDAIANAKTFVSSNVRITLNPGCPFLVPYYVSSSIVTYEKSYSDLGINYASTNYVVNVSSDADYREVAGLTAPAKNLTNEQLYRQYVYRNYLSVSSYTKELLLKIAEKNHLSAGSPTLITDIQQWIQGYATYDADMEPYPDNVDVALYFLTVAKRGDYRHFATAATLMYRAFGIPARYTYGFLVDAKANTYNPILGANAHAWVEVYVDGLGWVKMEVTPLIEGVPTEVDGQLLRVRPDGKYYVEIETASLEKVYDGNGFDSSMKEQIHFIKGELKSGHTLKVTYTNTSAVKAGEIRENSIEQIRVTDKFERDVTDQYVIQATYGKLICLKRSITICSSDATKPYDGMPLTEDRWWIASGSLAKGHRLIVKVDGTIVENGTTTNHFSYRIVDENDNVVTSQYNVTVLNGSLRITDPE